MEYIDLRNDEEILLEAASVRWINSNQNLNRQFDILILTNLRVHGRYKKSNGLFKEPSIEIVEFWLTDIKLLDGRLLVERKWDYNFFEWILEICTNHGISKFLFSESSKRTTSIWVSEIYRVVLGVEFPDSSSEMPLPEGLSRMRTGIKGFANSVRSSISVKEESISSANYEKQHDFTKNNASYEHMYENSFEDKSAPKANRFCSNCGAKLNAGSKFCSACGIQVGNVRQEDTAEHGFEKQENGKYQFRRQEYAGTVLKCPNCGNVVNSLDAICSACGMHLSERKSSDSVQQLSERLMEIENSSTIFNKGLLGFIGHEEREEQARADACRKKVTLINTFPLPNSVNEIYDFMMLALANIDIRLSKNNIMNNFSKNAPGDPQKEERAVSNAWVNKMQQVYQKAQALFPNDAAFMEIQNMYQQKMQELKML